MSNLFQSNLKEKVSVIVTTYNRSTYLDETLKSIAGQTYKPIELIVVDDGSKSSIARENESICANYSNCTYYYKPNTGQPDSRNYGIKKATGKFIGFCDDDDMWVESKIARQLNIFSIYPNIGLVSGSTEYMTHRGERTNQIKSHGVGEFKFVDFLLKNRIQSPTPLVKKEVFTEVGYFNTAFTIAEDWEFWRRVSFKYTIYNMEDVLAFVRLHDHNMSLTRKNTPIERLLLYRKLTRALLSWGKNRFHAKDTELISKTEWLFYRRILRNHFSGYIEKCKFLVKLGRINFNLSYHIIYLALRFELRK